MPAKFEDAVKILDANQHDAYALARHVPELVEGLKDACSRIQHMELNHVQTVHRLASLEEANNAWSGQINALAADRDAFRRRIDDVEKVPAASQEKLDAMDKRLRAVEGAVGSTAYKGTADKPVKPEDMPTPDSNAKPAPATAADQTVAQRTGVGENSPPLPNV